MTVGATMHPYEQEIIPEGKRLRMKDWLKIRIGNPRYPGLVWLDEEQQIFKIPWKHAALHGWDQNSDGALFRDWAEHTGSCVHNAHPKTLKATFRCALHSLPDVHEDKTMAKKRGDDACRVFKFTTTSSATPRKRHIRIRNHEQRKQARKTITRNPTQEGAKALSYPQPHVQWNYSTTNDTASSTNNIFSQSPAQFGKPINSQQQSNTWMYGGNEGNIQTISGAVTKTTEQASILYGFDEGFKPMHHSLSDSNIFPYNGNEDQTCYDYSTAVGHVSPSHSSRDAFSPQSQYDENASVYQPMPQGAMSPASKAMSDPGSPPCYYRNNNAYQYSTTSPPATYPTGYNTQEMLPFHQSAASSPVNSDYLRNPSPASSILSPCQNNSQMNSDFLQLGCQQNIIPTTSHSTDFELLNDIAKVTHQSSRTPYCTMSTTAAPSSHLQQAVSEFDSIQSAVNESNVDRNVLAKEFSGSADTVITEDQIEAFQFPAACVLDISGDSLESDSLTLQDLECAMSFGSLLGKPVVSQHNKLPAIETLSSL